jgi:type II secretion system protein N
VLKPGLVVAFSLLFVAAFCAFLYLTFPFAAFQTRLVDLAAAESGCRIVVQDQRVHFPFRFRWEGITADCPTPGAPYLIASVDADAAPLPLLWGGIGTLDYRVRLSSGQIDGQVTFQKGDSDVIQADYRARDIDLKQVGLAGQLSGEGAHRLQPGTAHSAEGRLSFTVRSFQLAKWGDWVSPIGPLTFDRVTGSLSWRQGILRLEQGRAEGTQIDVTATGGELIPRLPLPQSRISLSLQMTPKGSLKPLAAALVSGYSGEGPLNVTIAGSLAHPALLVER